MASSSDQDEDFTAQEMALALAPKFSAVLSMCGSSFIMYDVFKTGQVFTSTHHRLLMGMSACSFLVSLLAFFMSTWPIPADYYDNNNNQSNGGDDGFKVWGAVGNQASCDAQGFFSQFSLAVVIYNASLSTYYLAKIRYQISTKTLHGKLEPLLHIVPLTLALGTSIAGAALGLYNSEEWECWIAAYPKDCEESWTHEDGVTTCIRGDNASLYRWGFYYAFLWLAIFFVSINMFRVYRCVFEQEKKMNKYNFEYQRELEKLEKQRLQAELQELYDKQDAEDDDDNSSVDSAASHASARSVISVASSIAGSAFRSASFVARISYQSIKSIPKMQRKRDALKRHFKHSRQVATQGYWFLGAFLATWVFPTVARIVHLVTKQTFYPLILLTALFVPIQGFFNFLVYIQSHKKQRQEIQDTVCCCGWMKLPKRKRRKRHSTSSSTSNPGGAEKDVLPIDVKDVSSSHSSDMDFHEQSGSFKASSEIMRLSDVTSPEAAKAAAVATAIDRNPMPDDAENDMDATSRHANNMNSSDRQESAELQLTSEHLRELGKFDTHVGTSGGDDNHSDLTASHASVGSINARNTNDSSEGNLDGDDIPSEGEEEAARALRRPHSNNDLRTNERDSNNDLRASRRDRSDLREKSSIPLSIPLELEIVTIPNSSTSPMVDQSEITLGEDSSAGADQRRRGRSDRGAFHSSLIPTIRDEACESDISDSSEVNEQSASHHRVKRRGRRKRGDKNKKPSPLEALYRRTKTN